MDASNYEVAALGSQTRHLTRNFGLPKMVAKRSLSIRELFFLLSLFLKIELKHAQTFQLMYFPVYSVLSDVLCTFTFESTKYIQKYIKM